jgi:ribosomal protein L7/L12
MIFQRTNSKYPPYNKLDAIEKKLDLIIKHLGLEIPQPDYEMEIRELKRKGKEIEAIKRYRELTGADLKEAKDYVDKLVN